METVQKLIKNELHKFYDDYLEGLRQEERNGLDVLETILRTNGNSDISHLFPEDKKDIQKNFEDLKNE